jgi:hypothetical protein
MFSPFSEISTSSRIWVYQSDRRITADNLPVINAFLEDYCHHWKAHGNPLKASFEIRFDHFIILAADESFNGTSGCSIDDSVRAIKQIESITGLNFFDRNLIAFRLDNEIELIPLTSLKEKFASGILNGASLAFNNFVSTKKQLETEWLVSAGNSWLKRYIPTEAVKA